MIYRREILKGEECPPEYEMNLLDLLVKINKVRDAWSRPMTVTSGFRTMKDHIAIYVKKKIPKNKIPLASKHLYCQAVDIYDPDKTLQKWCIDNENLLAEIGLWMEHFSHTPNWVHFQTVSPVSGNRFFKIS